MKEKSTISVIHFTQKWTSPFIGILQFCILYYWQKSLYYWQKSYIYSFSSSEKYYPADELKAIRERKAIEAERREAKRLRYEARIAELANKRSRN